MWQHFKMQVPQVTAHARAHRNLAHVGVVRPRAGEELDEGPRYPARRCRPSDAAISRARRLHGDRRRSGAGGKSRGLSPTIRPAAFKAYEQERYLRTGRTQIMARVYGEFYHARGVDRGTARHALGGAHARADATTASPGFTAGRSATRRYFVRYFATSATSIAIWTAPCRAGTWSPA